MSKEKFRQALDKLEPQYRAKLKKPIAEALWTRAKAQAAAEGRSGHWDRVTAIYKSLGGH